MSERTPLPSPAKGALRGPGRLSSRSAGPERATNGTGAETPTAVTAKQARDLADAEARVTGLKKKLEDAEADRDKIRDRVRPKLKAGVEVLVGGVIVKRTTFKQERFSLSDYKTAGHKVTATMRKFVSRRPQERWTVKRAK